MIVLLVFIGGQISSIAIAALGWFAFERLRHRPEMHRATSEFSAECARQRELIRQMSEHAGEAAHIERARENG